MRLSNIQGAKGARSEHSFFYTNHKLFLCLLSQLQSPTNASDYPEGRWPCLGQESIHFVQELSLLA